ncbi:Protein-tyrosine phosphatase [Teladorsagia circumcincta]|uniref:Protein-tyrosine phosphatase n=1 Tax=Teladorsagia circumcincta TaxID=45464 RepID=A0A2G9UJK4_TELCI|nr:Protein-tyrosine phosphatase [Teladorsagia circumcincta]
MGTPRDFLHFDGSHVRVGEFKRVVIDRDWTMHVISVRSGDRRKYVHMHHYSGWTHGKQPVRLLDLWQIQSVFRRYTSPHIYMSLSGCGRAGTYAAFEARQDAFIFSIAHERLHSDSFQRLVIADCICRARQGRMHAVQRTIQLQTIHAAMMEHIMSTRVSAQLPTKTTQKYEEFMDRFNKCAEAQEDLP